MTTRDSWPQAQAHRSETVHWEAGSGGNTCNQARRACAATKTCMQTGSRAAGYKRREVFREESRMALSKGLCTRCQGSTARKDGEGHTVAGASGTPVLVQHFAGNSAWRRTEACRRRCGTRIGEVAEISGRVVVGREQFPVAGPGKAHGRP